MVRSCIVCVNVSLVYIPTLHSGSSPSVAAVWTQDYPRMFSLREIFKFKIYGTWPQANKQTYTNMCAINAALLVWGSLRLTQNMSFTSIHKSCREVLTLESGKQQDVLMMLNYRDK